MYCHTLVCFSLVLFTDWVLMIPVGKGDCECVVEEGRGPAGTEQGIS